MTVVLFATAVNGVEPIAGTPSMRVSLTMTHNQREATAVQLLGAMKSEELEKFLKVNFPEFVREVATC